MIKQLTFLLFAFLCTLDFCAAQEKHVRDSKNSFVEWNIGAAKLSDWDGIFPGTSVLWGSTVINNNNSIFEYEAGFAFPTIITGKMGVGKAFGKTRITTGIRPFPLNFYLQTNLSSGEKGYWIVSFEYNPLDEDFFLSFGSKAILNFGYRWNYD